MLRRVSVGLRRSSQPKTQSLIRLLHTPGVGPPHDDEKLTAALERIRQELVEDKKKLEWRTPVGDRPGDWNSKLKVFSDTEQNSDFIVMMQQLDLSAAGLKNWWVKRQEVIERQMQQYVTERHEILGTDLAAAHFLLYRGGAVKFLHADGWMRANEQAEFNLPNKFDPFFKVEALRCDNMTLYYEGLENLRCLENLKFLSFHNVKTFDDWCLDRVSGSQYPRLEVLDISGTECTANGLSCLYRLPTLKLLILDDPKQSLELELACSILEEAIPLLKIVPAKQIYDL